MLNVHFVSDMGWMLRIECRLGTDTVTALMQPTVWVGRQLLKTLTSLFTQLKGTDKGAVGDEVGKTGFVRFEETRVSLGTAT